MPRTHIVQSWVGSCEYPEGDQYSGEQIGNRNKPSIEVQIERSGDRWRTVGVDQHFTKTGAANIHAYSDPQQNPKRQVKPKSAFEQVNLADKNYERLLDLSTGLDMEHESGKLSTEDWIYARKQLDTRLDKAWQKVCHCRGWNPAQKDEEIYSLCIAEMEQKRKLKTMQNNVDNKAEQGAGFAQEVVDSLSSENVFKKPLKKLLTAKEKLVKMLTQTKVIWKE